jgi:nucleoside-diphosphate-sugar epimerase
MIHQNEKIMIFGASGFLGSWFIRVAVFNGLEVIPVVRPTSNISRLVGIPNTELQRIDPLDWPKFIRELEPKSVISFDWDGVGNAARNNSTQFGNIGRALKLAQAATDAKVQNFITFGSQAEVGPIESTITEESPLNPTTEYGKAKKLLLKNLQEIFTNSKTRFIWGRIFSTYGPMDSANWLIPQMITTLSKKEEFPMTKGEQVWNYLHAFDLSNALIKILDTETVSGIINIANPNTVIIADLANFVANELGTTNLVKLGRIEYREDQVMHLTADVEKLCSTGWKPIISIEEGLRHLIKWMVGQGRALDIDGNTSIPIPLFDQIKHGV